MSSRIFPCHCAWDRTVVLSKLALVHGINGFRTTCAEILYGRACSWMMTSQKISNTWQNIWFQESAFEDEASLVLVAMKGILSYKHSGMAVQRCPNFTYVWWRNDADVWRLFFVSLGLTAGLQKIYRSPKIVAADKVNNVAKNAF